MSLLVRTVQVVKWLRPILVSHLLQLGIATFYTGTGAGAGIVRVMHALLIGTERGCSRGRCFECGAKSMPALPAVLQTVMLPTQQSQCGRAT